MHEAAFERIQRRLIDQGRFQLKQTLTLQDDEIERLRDHLTELQSKILRHKTIWARKITRRQAKVSAARERIAEAREKMRGKLNEVSREHSLRVSAMQDSHDERLRDVNHDSKMFRKKQEASMYLEHQESSVIIEDTMRNVSMQIDMLNQEKEIEMKEQEKHAKKKIKKVKMKTEGLKKRIDELNAVIAVENEKYFKWKAKHKTKMSDIREKMEECESEVSQSKSRFLTRVNEMEDTQDEEPGELEELRRSVKLAQKRKAKIQRKIDRVQAEFEVSQERLKQEKSGLKRQSKGSFVEESQMPELKRKLAKEKMVLNEIQRLLDEKDPELQKLRERNLKLLRKVKEIDYTVNGRNGGFQRLTEITTLD